MLGEHGERLARTAGAIASRIDGVSPLAATIAPLDPREVLALEDAVSADADVAVLAGRIGADRVTPVRSGVRVELPVASFDALYLHAYTGTHLVAVPRIGAIAVLDGVEVYRARHGAAVLHRSASLRVRDARCHACLRWTELAAIWSIRAARDAAAVSVAAGLGLAALRHCAVEIVRR